MRRAVVLGLALLTLLIVTVSGMQSNIEFTKRCIEQYKSVLAHYNDEKGTCTRLQIFMDCLSNKPDERGQLLDAMRYFFTQQAIFVSKLNYCPKIDYKTIKAIASHTDFAKNHNYLDSIGDEEAWDTCAIDVHKYCVKKYVTLFAKERKICDDVNSWIDCYSEEARNIGCDAEILTHFSKMLSIVGKLVIREIRRFAGMECVKMEL
ncbi:uncharacterized protein LOC116289894 [Actinia tenebrosa]|uniref:Uncharacterized protein LOC116289894 n=1 Tax=Actinia tenebrosa TaxID=6105 RepID=A0A6P8H8C6_ACTTE|nr:uncharacterized protein LOC116289894 [Actinia tenebrosa]